MSIYTLYAAQMPERGIGNIYEYLFITFMRNFEKLSRADMKNVIGGVAACPTGQSLHSCTSSMSNGSSVTGSVCGSSSQGAANTQVSTWKAQGTWGGDGFDQVSCS